MKKLFIGILAGLLLSAAIAQPAEAFVFVPALLKGRTVAPPAYTGPGDVVSTALGWWGLRAYNNAYAASLGNAAEICTAADALCTVLHVTATGGLNASDISASGCGSITTCTVKTMYDQSGNGHNCAQATIASRPLFFPNGVTTGFPSVAIGNGSARFLGCTGLTATAVPYSFVAVVKETNNVGVGRIFVASNPIGLISNGANLAFNAGTTVSSSITWSASVFYALIGRTDGTGSGGVVSQSGTVTTGLAAGSTSTGTTGNLSLSSSGMAGEVTEFGYWGSNFSTGNTTSMNNNMQTYWGI